jgi:hypothetical protein
MADPRQSWPLAELNGQMVLPFLAELEAQFPSAKACDLRLAQLANGQVKVLLPHFNEAPRRPEAEVRALRQAVLLAAKAVLGREQPQRDTVSTDLEGADTLEVAFWRAVLSRLHPREEADEDWALSAKVAIIRGDGPEALADMARIVRRGRFTALTVGQAGQDIVSVLAFSDSTALQSHLAALRAADPRIEAMVLASVDTTEQRLWLPDKGTLALEDVARVGRGLAAMTSAGWLSSSVEIAVYPDPAEAPGPSTRILLCLMEFVPDSLTAVPAAEVFQDLDVGRRIELAPLTLVPSEAALATLGRKVAAQDMHVGYRIGLRGFPVNDIGRFDIESLTEEIDRLRATIAEIQANEAPQMRLLRFDDDQLPALVDCLRRLPPPMLESAGLTYCAAHAAGRQFPAHFLVYDPVRVSLESRLPEHYWRAVTSGHAISYWLDPYSAAAMQGDAGEPLIFVPMGQHISPPVASFGGKLRETMRMVLGNLFADASKILERSNARPMFVFSSPTEPWADVGLELLDMQDFVPVKLSLKWLNDNILVRSPEIADRATLATVAEELYSGHVTTGLLGRSQEGLAALDREWGEAMGRIVERFNAITRRLTEDLTAVSDRVVLAAEFVDVARQRIRVVDGAVAQFDEALRMAGAAEKAARTETEAHRRAQGDFSANLAQALAMSERRVELAEQRVLRERARIKEILDRLERGR